jgi:hypothetical protein
MVTLGNDHLPKESPMANAILRPLRGLLERILGTSVCLCLLMFGSPTNAGEDSDLLSTVRAHHRAARESIRTLRADITMETTFPKQELLRKGKIWRSFNTVRVQEFPDASGFEDFLLSESEIRQVGRSREPDGGFHYNASRSPASGQFCFCDVWRAMLFDFYGPTSARCNYDGFLDSARSNPRTRKEKIDGRDCVRVSMTCDTLKGDEWTIDFWHDVECNYFIRREVAQFGKQNEPVHYDILEFTEAAPGVFVPIRSRLQSFRKGELKSEEQMSLTDLQVNEEIPKDAFLLPSVPAGTILRDQIEGATYPIDENWKRIGAAEPPALCALRGRRVDSRGLYWLGSLVSSEADPRLPCIG